MSVEVQWNPDWWRGPAEKLRALLNDRGLRIEALAKTRTTVSTGMLQRSWTHRIEGEGLDMALIVGSGVKYALYYERGRGPGRMPPPDALVRWVKQRGMNERMAFVIARAIGLKGTKGHYPLSDAIESVFGKRPTLK